MRHVSDEERRARLAVRLGLGPGCRAGSVLDAARAVVALHATEPASVHLACRARVDDVSIEDVDRELVSERRLVKQLCMRRTLWAVPDELLPAAWGSSARRVLVAERRMLLREVEAAGLADDGEAWVARMRSEVLVALDASEAGLTASELRVALPELDVPNALAGGGGAVVSRVLRDLGLTADAVRGENAGQWRVLRPRWVPVSRWLPGAGEALDEADGWRELVARWLERFGPGTEEDVVWWLGATKGIVRRALGELSAVEVSLDGDRRGWLMPDDVDPVSDPGAWTALLPMLDPATMGWKQRDWYLGPHGPELFDRNGNGGTTAWVDGRIVGCWVQDDAGVVELRLLEDVGRAARRSLEADATALTEWLDGVRVTTNIPSPAMKR